MSDTFCMQMLLSILLFALPLIVKSNTFLGFNEFEKG